MPKSPDAFRTISEVAEWLDTPAHVLRFWESKFAQVKPVKRAGGRRYYRPADMQLLGGIKKLLHDDGLTIKGAQKLLREHGVKHVSAMSQALEDDLIAGNVESVPEAAFEVALPEPDPVPAATVLSFQPRKSEPAIIAETADTDPKPLADAPAPVAEQTNAAAEDTPHTEAETEDAFAPDTLPAFLKRAQVDPSGPSALEKSDVAAEDAPAKVTIDPVAHLLPAEAQEPAVENVAALSEAAETPNAAEPASTEPTPSESEAPSSTASVPSLEEIAPSIDSFEAAPSILTALDGVSALGKSDADAMVPLLAQMTALRTRMNAAQNA